MRPILKRRKKRKKEERKKVLGVYISFYVICAQTGVVDLTYKEHFEMNISL